jgi:hypothetical protein
MTVGQLKAMLQRCTDRMEVEIVIEGEWMSLEPDEIRFVAVGSNLLKEDR